MAAVWAVPSASSASASSAARSRVVWTTWRMVRLQRPPGSSLTGQDRNRLLPWYTRSNPSSEFETVSMGAHQASAAIVDDVTDTPM